MISEQLQDAINQQISREQYAAHLYLSMAAHFEGKNLRGFAKWMRHQSQEETAHGMKLFDFLADRGGRVTLKAIGEPPADFDSVQSVMEKALEHERQVTKDIYQLYELAQKVRDYAAHVLFEWFVSEQVEEERTLEEILAQIKLVGSEGTGLFLLDQRLSGRKNSATGEIAPAA